MAKKNETNVSVVESPKLQNLGEIYSVQGRYFFNDDRTILELPGLIEVQLDSYQDFLTRRLDKAFRESFPIDDFSGEKLSIYYKGFQLEEPKYSVMDCKRKNLNYEAPLKVRFEMLNKLTGEIKEQDVYLGGIPMMTDMGTFIVMGIERVIINQIIRSTGMFFTAMQGQPGMYAMKIIPQRGSWFEVEIERRGVVNVKIDKKRKLPVSILLRAWGYETDAEIIDAFQGEEEWIAKYIQPTLEKDKTKTRMEALYQIYKLLRPGDLGTDERVEQLFNTTFYDSKRFELGEVARLKVNRKLSETFDAHKQAIPMEEEADIENANQFLVSQDFLYGLKYLFSLIDGRPGFSSDDIDHLENRRVRSVGELVYDKVKVGLARMEKIAKDRMTVITDLDEATPGTFINSRPMIAVMREFFGTSQLSQFMEQTNPISELANKRRLSALGPGGLTRERAGFEVRDVHPTQYGRICPIATPEGPNIGLVLHFASYAKVDKYGFIMTPYRKVFKSVANDGKSAINRITLDDIVDEKGNVIVAEKTLIDEKTAKILQEKYSSKEIVVRGFVTDEYDYYDAYQERQLIIAEANTELDEFRNFAETRISARKKFEAGISHVRDITHIDISPKQLMSETTMLIPFLEHDDATRAEMGTNMMRQAVPLVRAEAPVVGTGMERVVGEGSGYVIKAEENGEVIGVDAKHITVIYESGKKQTYPLRTFEMSNTGMLVHQWARVFTGQKVVAGQILADGQSVDNGELAVGRNLRVAYMPWNGYNYEDAIIISEKVMQDDYYTSVHIAEYVMDVRETKLGPEQTTDDIPNVSTAKLANLDTDGIVRIGSYVEAGDILVGKVTPKGEVELSPEERLLRAIFGDKSKDVKDSSLYLPSGSGGKVIGVHKLRREEGDNLSTGVFEQIKVYVAQTRKIEVGDKMAGRHGNKGIVSRIVPVEDMPFMEDGTPVDILLNPLGVLSRMNIGQVLETHLGGAAKKLGIKVATPILNGLTTEQISDLMEKAGIPADGKVQLYDGRTGEPFKERTMVGIKYMLKLHHLVEDKIHARSVGPYSMITQQPLGGKAQNGGQRLGEMEVWALEGYGAANILQEMLTVKSDDINGRTQLYEAIVKGKRIKRPNVPESFNVLLREMQALNLNIDLLSSEEVDALTEKMKARYEEIEKLNGQFDIEMDLPEGGVIEDTTPVTTAIIDDEEPSEK